MIDLTRQGRAILSIAKTSNCSQQLSNLVCSYAQQTSNTNLDSKLAPMEDNQILVPNVWILGYAGVFL